MRAKIVHLLVAAGLQSLASAGALFPQAPSAEAEVREAVQGFKTALRAGEGDRALAYLHPEVRIYEGGRAESRDEYASGHLRADMAFLSAVETTIDRDTVLVGERMTLYLSEYSTRGSYRDREIDSHGTETIALVPTAEGWKIRHIHWSSR